MTALFLFGMWILQLAKTALVTRIQPSNLNSVIALITPNNVSSTALKEKRCSPSISMRTSRRARTTGILWSEAIPERFRCIELKMGYMSVRLWGIRTLSPALLRMVIFCLLAVTIWQLESGTRSSQILTPAKPRNSSKPWVLWKDTQHVSNYLFSI